MNVLSIASALAVALEATVVGVGLLWSALSFSRHPRTSMLIACALVLKALIGGCLLSLDLGILIAGSEPAGSRNLPQCADLVHTWLVENLWILQRRGHAVIQGIVVLGLAWAHVVPEQR